jgi:hypothetical protein
MLGDEMIGHIETCEGFKTCFPREHRKLFSGSSHPKLPLNEAHHLLKMTFGQLRFLKEEEGEAGQQQHKLTDVSAEAVEAFLHSWRPIVKPGVEEVLPSDFPPIRVPSFFGLIDHHHSSELEHGMFMDDIVAPSSSVVSESIIEDAPELVVYPELYLPPELLHPTSDPAYIAAAVAAHERREEETSPLVPVPFPSMILEEIPGHCFEEVAAPAGEGEYEWMVFSLGRDTNSHDVEGFHIQLHHQTVTWNDGEWFDRVL